MVVIWRVKDKWRLELVSRKKLVPLSPRGEGVRGISAEKRDRVGISVGKGAPRTIQASDLHGKPKEIKTIAGYTPKQCLQHR